MNAVTNETRVTELPPTPSRWQNWLVSYHWLMALAVYTGITLLLSRSILFHWNDSIIGPGGGDNEWYVWALWWFRHAMETGQDPAHTNVIFSLLPSVQIFVDGYFNLALAWPLQWLMSPLAAYNVVILLTFILSGLTMYLLATEFVRNRLACFAAGFLYTFSTFHFWRSAGHFGLVTMQWLPFCAWRVFVFFRRPSLKNAVLAGAGLALVPLSEIYYAAYFAEPFLLLFLIGKFISDRTWFLKSRHLLLGGLAVLVALIIAVPPLSSFLFVDADVKAVAKLLATTSVEGLSADLAAFILPDQFNPVFGWLTAPIYHTMKSPFEMEKGLFLGYINLLFGLSAFLFRRNRTRSAYFWLFLGVSGFVLALGPVLYIAGHPVLNLPAYKLLFGWPLLSTFRAPNRLVVLPLLALTLLAAYTLDSLLSHVAAGMLSKLMQVSLVAVVLGMSLTEHNLWSFSIPSVPVQTPALYREIATDTSDTLLLDLPLVPAGTYQYDQTIHHKRLVYGYAPRMTSRMFNSVQLVPYLSNFDWATISETSIPEGNQSDIYTANVNMEFTRGLQENRIKYVILHRIVSYPIYSKLYGFLSRTLGIPFYNNTGEGLTAWQVSPRTAPDTDFYHFRLGTGWLNGLATFNHLPLRSVEQDAQLFIAIPRSVDPSLSFQAFAYFKPLTIEIRVNGVLVKSVALSKPFAVQTVNIGKVNLKSGENIVRIHAVEGCSRPGDFSPQNTDPRCFSLGIQQIQITSSKG